MDDFYVYGYSDPESTDPYFYIGKGRGNRAYQHLTLCRRKAIGHFYKKLKKILEEGRKPKITFLSKNLTEGAALQFEITLIHVYGRIDLGTGYLCNHTGGGEGVSGIQFTQKELQR